MKKPRLKEQSLESTGSIVVRSGKTWVKHVHQGFSVQTLVTVLVIGVVFGLILGSMDPLHLFLH